VAFLNISLTGGWEIFGAFLIVFTFAVIYSLYTRRGSGINQHPYGDVYGGQPGALGTSVLHHDETAATRYTRGTKAGRDLARRRPVETVVVEPERTAPAEGESSALPVQSTWTAR
jgi:hypothetical protein